MKSLSSVKLHLTEKAETTELRRVSQHIENKQFFCHETKWLNVPEVSANVELIPTVKQTSV